MFYGAFLTLIMLRTMGTHTAFCQKSWVKCLDFKLSDGQNLLGKIESKCNEDSSCSKIE